MTKPRPTEFELIRRYFQPLAAGERGALALGDDAAVLSPGAGQDLVVTTDGVVEGVHFLAQTGAADIAVKALAVNLSDLAAMGAEARWYTVVLALADRQDGDWLDGFAAGLAELQTRFAVTLVGGDTVATPGPLSVSITAFGEVPAGQALTRAGARAGDAIWVSGVIGDGVRGLAGLRGTIPSVEDAALDRYLRPVPRLALGQRLRGIATSCVDISDGLVADLGHICRASVCDAEVAADVVPLSPGARESVAHGRIELAALITGGDDYELLFTAPEDATETIVALASDLALPLTRIGRVTPAAADRGQPVRVLSADGSELDFETIGYRHF